MDLIQLMPRLYFIRLPVGHAYLWHDPDGLTLIDAGLPGSAPLIADAIRQSGHRPADLRRLVLTHFHADHIGAAAAIADWGDVEVLAHHADAPFIRAAAVGPAPDLADWEKPIYEQVMSPPTSASTPATGYCAIRRSACRRRTPEPWRKYGRTARPYVSPPVDYQTAGRIPELGSGGLPSGGRMHLARSPFRVHQTGRPGTPTRKS